MNALRRSNYIGVIVQVGVVSGTLLSHPCARAQQRTPVWQQEVRCYAQARDWTAALAIVDREIDSFPRDMDMRAWRARILTWSGKLAEAEREYLQILAISPNDPDDWLGLANVYSRQARQAEALQALNHAVELDPNRADIRAARATALRAAGLEDAAKLEIRRALELDPGNPDWRAFGDTTLRYISLQVLQNHFAGMADKPIGGPTVLKIKEILSSVLANAVLNDCLVKNPALHVAIPRSKVVNRHRRKPNLSPEEFNNLLLLIDEPYSTMVYVAVHSGLRVSELVGLKWEDVGTDCLRGDERYCRGDWSVPKTNVSSATIGVASSVIATIQRLKTLELEINWAVKARKRKSRLSAPANRPIWFFRASEPERR